MFDPSRYTEDFTREQGFTAAEWRQVLPGAVAPHALELAPGADEARVAIGPGALQLRWTTLSPRQIALMRMPRLQVHYRFDAVPEAERVRFMRHFDLYTQRGGG